ncbi:unnamed protein product [Brassica rapa subsp. narinosa]
MTINEQKHITKSNGTRNRIIKRVQKDFQKILKRRSDKMFEQQGRRFYF